MLPFTLQQLRMLKAVATEKNFTKAAQLLYISQPSLSKQLKKLEKNLDILLINRKKNKISLTENGKIFLAIFRTNFSFMRRKLSCFNRFKKWRTWEFNCRSKSNNWNLLITPRSCIIYSTLSSNYS